MFNEQDFLHTDGTLIKNARGETVFLRGTNLGGWLMREGWLDGSGACATPLNISACASRENQIQIRLNKTAKWNRIRINQQVTGKYAVKVSKNGIFYKELCSGSFDLETCPKCPDGYASEYVMGGDSYNEGFYYYKGCLYFKACKYPHIRLETECLLDAEKLEVCHYADVDEFSARNALETRFGEVEAERLLSVYQKVYITQRDLDELKDLGFNFLRVPIYWQELMDKHGNFKENAWQETDWIVRECSRRNIYVMLDFHGAPGGHTAGSITCGQLGSNKLWTQPEYQRMTCEMITALADRYKDEPAVAMIDLLNEPVANVIIPTRINLSNFFDMTFAKKTRKIVIDMYQRLYNTARSVDKRHILVLQPFVDYEMLGNPTDQGWENVAYQYHSYGINWHDHDAVQKSMQLYLSKHKKALTDYNIPILAGEFCFWGFTDIWESWLQELNALGIHWCNWTYKVLDTEKEHNWAIRYHFGGELVDYYRDSAEQIEKKFSAFGSENYRCNDLIAQILSKYTKS